VDFADDWKDLPWRFFIRNNDFVSKQAANECQDRPSEKFLK
jgi:3-methyladenine DNA glycosylase Mpg